MNTNKSVRILIDSINLEHFAFDARISYCNLVTHAQCLFDLKTDKLALEKIIVYYDCDDVRLKIESQLALREVVFCSKQRQSHGDKYYADADVEICLDVSDSNADFIVICSNSVHLTPIFRRYDLYSIGINLPRELRKSAVKYKEINSDPSFYL